MNLSYSYCIVSDKLEQTLYIKNIKNKLFKSDYYFDNFDHINLSYINIKGKPGKVKC